MGKKTRYTPPAAQVIMRREMEQPKKLRTLGDRDRDVMSLDDVFNEAIGKAEVKAEQMDSTISKYGEQQRRATQLVYDIIDQHELHLPLKQWQVVQTMMEQAVMTGVQLEQDYQRV